MLQACRAAVFAEDIYMKTRIPLRDTLKKDGTGQAQRALKALDPAYFQPEDRTPEDWLLYARELSKLMRYADAYSTADRTWEPFLDWEREGLTWEEVVKYLNGDLVPGLSPEKMTWLSRPHFVLLAAFLRLLQIPKDQINGFTRRHLDFYYREVLRFVPRKFIPDKAHLVIGLEEGAGQFLLKKGTLFQAGKDSSGADIHFMATRDTLLNLAAVTDLRSWLVDGEELSMEDVLLKYRNSPDDDFGFKPIMDLVYGLPNPGDSLWERDQKYMESLYTVLEQFENMLEKIREQVALTSSEFMRLMRFKYDGSGEPGKIVDDLLSQAGRKKKGDPRFAISGTDLDNFDGQVGAAIGNVNLAPFFDNLYDAYHQIDKIEEFFSLPADDVVFLLKIRSKLRNRQIPDHRELRQFYELLQGAFVRHGRWRRIMKLMAIWQSQGLDKAIEYALGYPKPGDGLPPYGYTLEEIYNDLKNRPDLTMHDAYLKDKLLLNRQEFMEATHGSSDHWLIPLEKVMRLKTEGDEEKIEMRTWNRVCKNSNVSGSVAAGAGWRPFGSTQDDSAEIGIAIVSSLLRLKAGVRELTITLGFEPSGANWEMIRKDLAEKRYPFSFLFSTAKGYFNVPDSALKMSLEKEPPGDKKFWVIVTTITLQESDPAIVAPEATAFAEPVLKVVLRETTSGTKRHVPYMSYKEMKLFNVWIKLAVEGIRPLLEDDDTGTINPQKPFEPFGAQPEVGSSLYFWDDEIAEKKIDAFKLSFQWMDAPADVAKYYAHYPAVSGKSFKARLQMFKDRTSHDLGEIDLFGAVKTIDVSENRDSFLYSGPSVSADEGDRGIWHTSRYFSLTLQDPDFQHGNYTAVASQLSGQYVKALTTTPPPSPPPLASDYQVNLPYTPKLKSFKLGYSCLSRIGLDSVYHLQPFGMQPLSGTSPFFLPRYEAKGALLLGIVNFNPPDVLSLLFQVEDGSAHPERPKPKVSFSYLTDSGWRVLDDAHVMDTTRNFSHPGILQLTIPEDASKSSILVSPGKHWIMLSAAENEAGVSSFLSVSAGGVEVVMDENAQRYAKLLPGAITATVADAPAIKSIVQPYPSFGGRESEAGDVLYTRISERLRHKQRAVTVWDYERLVLQQFPDVRRVKALPVTSPGSDVKVIVIPDTRNRTGLDPFGPRFSQAYRDDVAEYLRQHCSHHASVQVLNPEYVRVKIRVSVRFKPGVSERYWQQELNTVLQRFLSPWAFDQSSEITFGGTVYANTVVSFLDGYDCIDYILGLKFFTSKDGFNFSPVTERDDVNQVAPERPECILVSADTHEFDIVPDLKTDVDDLQGIGYMKIELDFEIQ